MFSIERVCESLFHRSCLEIFREHGGPGDRLEKHPMRPGRRNYGNDHERMAKLPEHEPTLANSGVFVKELGVLRP
jgi:hypothetical protein